MKKQISLIVAAICFSITSLMAQGNMHRQTPEERTKEAMEKMSPLKLSEEAKAKTEIVMSDFFTAQQNALKEMRESGNMDREAMQTKHKELAEERNSKLKLIFTQDQLKKWKDEIEPGLQPQRPPRQN